jgi:hypothetical protein
MSSKLPLYSVLEVNFFLFPLQKTNSCLYLFKILVCYSLPFTFLVVLVGWKPALKLELEANLLKWCNLVKLSLLHRADEHKSLRDIASNNIFTFFKRNPLFSNKKFIHRTALLLCFKVQFFILFSVSILQNKMTIV